MDVQQQSLNEFPQDITTGLVKRIDSYSILLLKYFDIFSGLKDYFDIDFTKDENEIIDSFMSPRDLNPILIKNKLLQTVYTSFEKILSDQTYQLQDSISHQNNMQTAIEVQNFKIHQLEKNINVVQKELKEKELAVEAMNAREIQKNQIMSVQAYAQAQLKQCALKSELNSTNQAIIDLSNKVQEKVDNEKYQIDQKLRTSQMMNNMIKHTESSFAQKGDTNELLKRSQREIKQQIFNLQQHQERLKQIDIHILNMQSEILLKTNLDEFHAFQKFADFYVHKDDISSMYTEIIPKVNQMNTDVVCCLQEIENFKKFVQKIDYDVLFKASKMDLELLGLQVQQQKSLIYITNAHLEENCMDLKTTQLQLSQFYDLNIESMTQNVLQRMIKELQPCIRNEVLVTFSTFKNIGHDLEALKQQIQLKVDVSDMLEIVDSKTSKVSLNEIMFEQKQCMIYLFRVCCGSLTLTQLIGSTLDFGQKRRQFEQVLLDTTLLNSHLQDLTLETPTDLFLKEREHFKKFVGMPSKSLQKTNESKGIFNILNDSLIDGSRRKIIHKPILKPLQVSQDGRWTPERIHCKAESNTNSYRQSSRLLNISKLDKH